MFNESINKTSFNQTFVKEKEKNVDLINFPYKI